MNTTMIFYDNWGGYNLLVKLNQRNPEVQDYICDVIRYWVSEFDVDESVWMLPMYWILISCVRSAILQKKSNRISG